MNRKRIKYAILYFVAQYLGPLLVGAIALTMRNKVVGREHWDAYRHGGKYIIASLHGRMFMPIWTLRKNNLTALVSQSQDGEIITRLIMGFGYGAVRGSSNRGALAAVRGLLNVLKKGPIAILVDGPQGPLEEPKIGSVAVARASGHPIIPCAGATWPAWEFRSWDRFQFPKPFGRGVMVFGEPFTVPSDVKGEELEEWRLELKKRLVSLREEADRLARVGS